MCGIVNNSRQSKQINELSVGKEKIKKSEISEIRDSKPSIVVLNISKHITKHRW